MAYFIVTILIIVVIGFLVIGIYNKLVKGRNYYQNAYAQIDVQLKRRYDLIPNLVEAAKAYMSHERETLEAVIKARSAAQSANQKAASNPGDPSAMAGLMGAEAALTGSLGRLFALSEAYPDLKADKNISNLQEELTSTENKIAFSRQAFNDAVMRYNNQREVFPASMVAGVFNFERAALLELTSAEEREAPKVQF